ncbi:hypothetical protein A2477_03200 [Candidatus Falkowbacteria bacterium RIFOXYC2_FULL_47_12]|uniref:Uncharacterized protein n=2 Tax=Candidatus Falkowiibacteriota TaxID=1752728 RepID=A0A1F5TQY3_9BACT|nr:MAG: hypothetical protein A2242_01895 [Candidatus Falkowbacteria bacterium RIFOXYA2_FULL_47_9]OGF41335.1 MAG: hypothetical protein A2477_03200 [Candidatus Falkowbacteria bacterium RIFOXYC2_FULL_47_12]
MGKIQTSSPDDKILFRIQFALLALQEQAAAAEEEKLPLRQRNEGLSRWPQEETIETKKISLN